ncbi:predicted protein [Nematostella vectensis]|uniref:Anticodon-binding domain-containing protein n=1 Tax=Nematostella vectensis TaxID=45351 RepID=A7SZW0_NEMVE|nr:predicted protein [Nematostella vectensis]|eukprot:XP_001622858.1 predicted protein [Nematostella vectensis]
MVTSKGSVNGVEISSFSRNISINNAKSDSKNTSNKGSGKSYQIVDTQKLIKRFKNLLQTNEIRDVDLKSCFEENFSGHSLALPAQDGIVDEGLNMISNLSHTGNPIQLPYGLAWCGKYYNMCDNASNSFQEEEYLNLLFTCSDVHAQHWSNFWNRCRLTWWKKIANVPSNFMLLDQSNDISNNNGNMEIKYDVQAFQDPLDTIKKMTGDSLDGDIINCLTTHDGTSLLLIQISTSLDQAFSALMTDAFKEKELADSCGHVSVRPVLNLHPLVAPVKVSLVLEDASKKDLMEVSHQLATELRQAGINVTCEDSATPEECYGYNDGIGTPYCITIMESTLSNGIIAFRSRNTTLQEYLHISDVLNTVQQHLGM